MAERWPIEPGKYEYTRSDGSSGVNTVKPDGTFSHVSSDGKTETGTWCEEGDWSCIRSSSGAERRYQFTQPDAEGNFTGTMDTGITARLRKLA